MPPLGGARWVWVCRCLAPTLLGPPPNPLLGVPIRPPCPTWMARVFSLSAS